MSIEEKAKAYDEALERARELIAKWTGKNKDFYVEDYAYIFPELRESEDEKTRKELMNEICCLRASEEKGSDRYESLTRMLIYLQRQKEQKPDIEICPHSIKSKSYKENGYPIENCDYGLEIALAILEKTLGEVQGYQTDDGLREHQTAIKAVKDAMKEQKPVWSEEDEKMLNRIIETLSLPPIYDTKACAKMVSWLKSFPERFNLQPKQEWSEKDERILTSIIERGSVQVPPYTTALREEQIEWLMNRLKSLRPQSKTAEWSEEDETRRTNAIILLQTPILRKVYQQSQVDKAVKWLRNLRPSRKLSEDQIYTLERICSNLHLRASDDAPKLDEIIELLKQK